MDKQYKVVAPYTSYYYGFPMLIPVGTIFTFWEERGFYTAPAINNYVPVVSKWAVEAWCEYFEEVTK